VSSLAPPSAPASGLRLPREVLLALVMTAVMLVIAVLSELGRPIYKLADERPRVQLEQLVPDTFGDWRLLKTGGVVLPNPQALETLNRIYTQTLSRAYIDSKGTVIMLSLAYGDDQRAAMAVHYPEICYPAQGFQLKSSHVDHVSTLHGMLPVRRLETSLSAQRYEPLTYWVTIGDRISLGGFERRMIELEYGLQRIVPDGLLFRVSSVNRDSAEAWSDQDRFIRQLLASLPPASRAWLAGDPARLRAAAP
jgi:EpsI family protein